MAIQLYAKKQGTGEWVSLDLHPADPMKLNLSVQNIIDPTATTSVFSKTFRVPHTSVNGPYFKGVFNVNSMDFDAAKKADAYILDNGIFFQNGNITLNAIYSNDKDGSVEYDITFYGATSDFGTKIGGGFLNELNLNQYNHTKNSSNIISSWTNGLFNGDVVYGLIEWGYTYNEKNQPSLPTLSANFVPSPGSPASAKGSFTNPLYPLLDTQWKPQIRAKALWDNIFEEAGYTYDSTFLNSTLFKNMYIISENVSEATLDNSNEFSADNNITYSNVVAAQFDWLAPHEISDPGGNYNPATSHYVAPAQGSYTFKITCPTIVVQSGGIHQDRFLDWEASLVDVDTGQVLDWQTGQWTIPAYDQEVYFDPQWYPNGFFTLLGAGLNVNQKVKVVFRTMTVPGGGPIYSGSTNIHFYTQGFECTSAPNIMSFSAIMPANIRKIDFMKSIINRFRLVFVPSKFQANHFEITPWKDWILQGDSIDWTNKLDASKDMVIKPLFYDQERFQIYKDQEDSDYINYNYQLTYKQTIGQLNLDSTNELIKGTKEYKDQFAPTPIAPIGWKEGTGTFPNNISYIDAAKFVIPHIAKDSTTNDPAQPGKREPIQPKLRLVFYNGLITAPVTWYMQGSLQTSYPLMSQYSTWPVTSTTYDLNWRNSTPNWDTDILGTAQTTVTTFDTYWKTWYDTTFDPYSRIVEANFVLDYNDIIDLKFNDYVFVKDAWYFVNSISDYIPGQKTNCRVQLVKVGNNIGITVPVVTPPTLQGVTACFAQTACNSHCCTISAGASTQTIYVNGTTLGDSTSAYVDAYGTTPAPTGYYTDSTGTFFVTGVGYISSCTGGVNAPCVPIDVSNCQCAPTYYQFTVQYDNHSTGCTVCCSGGSTVVVYGTSPTFESNSALYLNTGLTQGAPAGFYLLPGPGANAVQVGSNNGAVTQVFLCSNCTCTTLYPFNVNYGASLCTSCCNLNPITVWGDNATFSSCTHLYTSNLGTTPVAIGYYKFDSNTVANVTTIDGEITSFATCSSCNCSGTATYKLLAYQEFEGFTTTATLQKSLDGINGWTDVATASVTDTQQGISADSTWPTTEVTGSVPANVYLRVVYSTTARGFDISKATLSIAAVLNSDQWSSGEGHPAPSTQTFTVPFITGDDDNYDFYIGATGGTPNRLYLGGEFRLYENQTWPFNSGYINDAVALTATDAIATNFNIGASYAGDNGFVNGVEDVQLMPDSNNILFVGTFNYYKGVQITRGMAILNEHGDLVGVGDGSALDGNTLSAQILYADNTYIFIRTSIWNGVSTGAKQMVILQNTETGWTASNNLNNVVFNSTVNSVTADYDSGTPKYYLTGYFTTVTSQGVPYTFNKIVSFNWSPTAAEVINFDFNPGTGYNSTTNPLSIKHYNGKLYVAFLSSSNTTFTYNGVSLGVKTGIHRIKFDGTTDTSWTIKKIEFVNAYNKILQPSKRGLGIYVLANTYDTSITTGGNVIRLDYTGLIDNTFAYNNTLSSVLNIHVDANDNVYYYYGMTSFTPNGGSLISNPSVIKINSSGVFQHAYLLQDSTSSTKFSVKGIASTNAGSTSGNQLQLYKTDSTCGSFCHTGMTPTTYYGDAPTLAASTTIYLNQDGITPAPTGIYSDGIVTYQVINGVKQFPALDTSGCNCGMTLYEYATNYDSTDCNACCGTVTTYVYGNSNTWSTNTILYTNPGGSDFASPGYYSFNQGIVLQVGSNGVVISSQFCSDVCSCGGSAPKIYEIQNVGPDPIDIQYLDCNGAWQHIYGLWSGTSEFTECVSDIGSISANPSTYSIVKTIPCNCV